MAKVQISRREFTRAWKQAQSVSLSNERNNYHRLLLFYSVECGLKAAFMKRNRIEEMDKSCEFFSHNLNDIIDKLGIGNSYNLPVNLEIEKLQSQSKNRAVDCGSLNVIWRYGAKEIRYGDAVLEEKLEAINEWLTQTINRL